MEPAEDVGLGSGVVISELTSIIELIAVPACALALSVGGKL
jgi:hypothetical protein